MSTFSANVTQKIDSPVNVYAASAAAVLVVPTGKIFRGTASSYQLNGSGETVFITKSGSGRIISVLAENLNLRCAETIWVELSEGTYTLDMDGAPLNRTNAFHGNFYVNTP